MRYLFLLTVIGSLAAGGCGSSAEAEAEAIGDLARSWETTNAELHDELTRIQAEGGTPELLNESDVPSNDNVAVELLGLFTDHKLSAIRERADNLFPAKRFAFNPVQLSQAVAFRMRYEKQLKTARAALERPLCDFGIQFMAGHLAEMEFVDTVHLCANLEAFQAADALFGEKPQPDDAVKAFWNMLRLATCLGAEKHPVARLEAAYVRTKAFAVIQAIVKHEKVGQEHLELLEQIVRTELESWPDDADAWIGERALGLHAYEMVRRGLARELLLEEDVARFHKEGILADFSETAKQNVDQDELFYVQAMRKIIEDCGQPYYLRKEIEEMRADMHSRRSTSAFPLVASRLLLLDVPEAQVTIAQDRANWEAWALALSLATGRPTPDYKINPLTGRPYYAQEYHSDDGRLDVYDGGDTPQTLFVQAKGKRAEIAVRDFSLDEPGDAPTWIVVPFDLEARQP